MTIMSLCELQLARFSPATASAGYILRCHGDIYVGCNLRYLTLSLSMDLNRTFSPALCKSTSDILCIIFGRTT